VNELALFAGAGGGILGGHLLGWRTICAVEWEPYPASVLMQRQNDGILPPFPIWDDVQTFDGKPWRGLVDVVSGGFPCQDISAAGKGAGIDGTRSGMWFHMARIIREVGPRFCFVENSPMLTSRGLGRVLGDLASMGYNARWGVLGAVDAGAPHKRDRIWILGTLANAVLAGQRGKQRKSENEGAALADTNSMRKLQSKRDESDQWRRVGDSGKVMADALRKRSTPGTTNSQGRQEGNTGKPNDRSQDMGNPMRRGLQKPEFESSKERTSGAGVGPRFTRAGWWSTEPDLGRVAHGVAARVDRLKAIGNGQVPAVVRLAWQILSEGGEP